MRLIQLNAACVVAILALDLLSSASANELPRFAIERVFASARGPAAQVDAGVALQGARFVRLSISGVLQSPDLRSQCPRIAADGCALGTTSDKVAYGAPAGALLAKFVDANGADVAPWTATGRLAMLPVPARAARLVYRINGGGASESGAFRVVTDVILDTAGASPVVKPADRFASRTRTATSSAQHLEVELLLRRLGFGAEPAEVAAVEREGVPAWLDSQLRPLSIDDEAAEESLVPQPLYFQFLGAYSYDMFAYEAMLPELEYATKRQLLEKVTLHWLEHFSVGRSKALAPYIDRYLATVRRDALGNFAQLLIDVAKEPAMLAWLDNNENMASPTVSPNENFARELLQLYVMGTNQLNWDGSEVVDSHGQPVENYSQGDVTALAAAMTGYAIVDRPLLNTRPIDDVSTAFLKARHGAGPYRVFGRELHDPGDQTAIDAAIRFIVHNSNSIAPFEAKELLVRLVTETPSPAYVGRIARVWQANVDSPEQIANVVRAIVLDPEFSAGRGQMVKEPIEYVLDTYRSLPVKRVAQTSRLDYCMHNLVVTEMPALEQDLYAPESVFSFYRPGDKESLLTDSELLVRWQFAARFVRGGDPSFVLDMPALSALAGGSNPDKTVAYLLGSLVDGGTPQFQALLENYLHDPGADVRDVLWLILISPEYEEN